MSWIRTTLLLTLLTALFLLIGHALGGQNGMIFAFILAVVMNFGAYWFSDKIVLKLYRAKPVSLNEAPEFYRIVKDLARRANIPMPKLYIVESDTPNAFATGRNPKHAAIAVTTGILRILTPEELSGVIAHELSHVQHRDTLISAIAATLAGAIAMIANLAQWAAIFGGRHENNHSFGLLGSLVMIILAPILAAIIQLAVSRSREYAADKKGAILTGNPRGLANALRKLELANEQMPMKTAENFPTTAHLFIVNPLSRQGIMNLFSTHPPIAERIKRLEGGRGVS